MLNPYRRRWLSAMMHCFLRRPGVWLFYNSEGKPWRGNLKAVCDACVHDPDLTRIVIINHGITPSETLRQQYQGSRNPVVVFDQWSPSAIVAALSADVDFSTEAGRYVLPSFSVNLWHGVPLKKIGAYQHTVRKIVPPRFLRRRSKRRLKNPKKLNRYQRLISSSQHDHVVMTSCFLMHPANVINCGLPRNDWLDPDFPLPPEYQKELERLEKACQGRALCLYAPTFRDESFKKPPISRESLEGLAQTVAAQGMVLGVRPHITVNDNFYHDMTDCIDLSSSRFPEIQILLRHAAMLITDYSSCAIDYMLTGRPCISYAPDMAAYSRGFLYDFPSVFPGLIVQDRATLLATTRQVINHGEARQQALDKASRVAHLFHEPGRRNISRNLVEQIKKIRDSRVLD